MSLPAVAPGDGVRARRWDALVLGSGLSALVTAARLGMAGQRVLVVEEEAAATAFAGLREPFLLAGARDSGLVDLTLRELTLSLIDRRRIEEQDLAYQVLGPELRLDVGASELSAEELVGWGLCKPDDAYGLTRAIHDAARAEGKAMLSAPLVRLGRRIGRGRVGLEGSHRRGLPAEASNPGPRLGPVLAAQIRALSNLAEALPGPESQARLLGTALAGGAGFNAGPPWLYSLLRQRVESVFGEFRTLARGFRLVSVLNQPGIAVEDSRELWVGRILVLAAPPTAIASVLKPGDVPSFLPSQRKVRKRLAVHLRVQRSVVPEGLCDRAILMSNSPGAGAVDSTLTLNCFLRENDPKWLDLVVRGLAQEGVPEEVQENEMMARVLEILPFSEGKVERRAVRRPRWDDDNWLEDPKLGACWPGEMDLRLNGKPPVYLLDRAWVAGLGLEGDLLLGLRAGEALAGELS